MSQTDEDPLALRLPGGRTVPPELVHWRATTSGRPGGQHANRTASRVTASVRIDELPLSGHERGLLYSRLASRITGSGEIAASAGDHRQQSRNRRAAIRRLEKLIADSLHEHRTRIPTKESRGAQLRRREAKQRHAQKKSSRRWNWGGSE